jgi:taurine dioxygenase
MEFTIRPSGQSCGASAFGIDLSQPLAPNQISAIRAAWLDNLVLSFPDQQLTLEDLERLTGYFGRFAENRYLGAVDGHENIVALTRKANEQTTLFTENWHTGGSFMERPPTGTCLYADQIPDQGGDTLYANQQMALASMPQPLRDRIDGKIALHSAKYVFAPDGTYGAEDAGRSMRIRYSTDAENIIRHPLVLKHQETGQSGLFGCIGYIVGLENMAQSDASKLLTDLYLWQTSDEFIYRHSWSRNMFVIADNRALLHRATGGYQGQDRRILRSTFGPPPA